MRSRRRLLLLAASTAALFAVAALGVPHTPAALRALIGPLGAAARGLLFGTALGTAVSIAGATLGSVVSFVIARRFGRRAVEDVSGPRLERFQTRIERRGFAAVLYARLAPGVPVT